MRSYTWVMKAKPAISLNTQFLWGIATFPCPFILPVFSIIMEPDCLYLHKFPADWIHALRLIIWLLLIFCSLHVGSHQPLSSRRVALIYHMHFVTLKYLSKVSSVNCLCSFRPSPQLESAMFWKSHTYTHTDLHVALWAVVPMLCLLDLVRAYSFLTYGQ